jgi:hypothetical protein
MKKIRSFNTALAVVLGLSCLTLLLLQTAAPLLLLPPLNIPNLAFPAAAAMIVVYCAADRVPAVHWMGPVLGGVACAVLPWCAGLTGSSELLKYFLAGTAVTAVVWLVLDSLSKRLTGRPRRKLTFALNALLLALAFQGFGGMWL